MFVDASTHDLIVLWLVVGLRFLVPLAIPYYPLPGVIVALVLDGIDQTLFQSFTRLDLSAYQGYDKALDIYYLSIAYISTLRNWTNHFAFKVSRFLFYYRLVGVVAFEITAFRPLLLIFPNTFEYFFIWYETVRLWRDPLQLSRRSILAAAAAIWIVIKLPQEFWIHIARLDVTDVLKTGVFGETPETPWGHIMAAAPWLFVGIALAAVAFIALLAWLAGRHLATRTEPLTFRGDRGRPPYSRERLSAAKAAWARVVFDRDLLEKAALVTLITVIFAQVLPGVSSTTLQVTVAVVAVIVLNTLLSHWLARAGVGWRNAFGQFLVMAGANFTLVFFFRVLPGSRDLPAAAALFFVLLLSLIVTFFDRYQEIYFARFRVEVVGSKEP